MKFAIIVSKKDIAGMSIREELIKDMHDTGLFFQKNPIYKASLFGKEVKLYTLESDTIFFETAESDIETDYFIFATRHQSKSGEKTLSVHFPGNFSKAEYGGQEGKFCMASVSLLKQAFLILKERAKSLDYSITMEATHHGPLIRKPVMFIEIGSREEQWKDKEAAYAIKDTIFETIRSYEKKEYKTAIGFGGMHYCSNFNKIESSETKAMSHICPKYNIEKLDRDKIEQMISSSDCKIDYALLDWKGITGKDKQPLLKLFEDIGLEWNKV